MYKIIYSPKAIEDLQKLRRSEPAAYKKAEKFAVETNYEYQEKMNPYKNGLPDDKAEEIRQRYLDFFKIYYKHRDKISRINLWGISDKNSWLNDWLIKGRTNYPLLFDRNYQPKPVVEDIINLYK